MAQMWKEGGCGLKKLFCIASFMSQNLIQCNIRRGVLIQENHWKTGCKSRLPSWEKAPEHLFWRAWQGVVHTPLHSMLVATSHRCKGPKEQNGFLTEKKKSNSIALIRLYWSFSKPIRKFSPSRSSSLLQKRRGGRVWDWPSGSLEWQPFFLAGKWTWHWICHPFLIGSICQAAMATVKITTYGISCAWSYRIDILLGK